MTHLPKPGLLTAYLAYAPSRRYGEPLDALTGLAAALADCVAPSQPVTAAYDACISRAYSALLDLLVICNRIGQHHPELLGRLLGDVDRLFETSPNPQLDALVAVVIERASHAGYSEPVAISEVAS